MRRRPSLISKILRKLRGAPRPKVIPPRERKVMPSLEPLEGRIAPATLINPTTVMFKDLDGDIVTVKFSKALFDSTTDANKLSAANSVLKFSTGTVDTLATSFSGTGTGQQLQLIDLTKARTVNGVNLANGTTVTVSVVKAGGGDGFTNVGYIHAFEQSGPTTSQVPLGAVSIAGDLGQIDAGGLATKIGVASLKVKSLGVANPSTTQPAATAGLPSSRTLTSNIIGMLGSLTVTGDVNGATILAQNGNSVYGAIGNVTIGGSLIGGSAQESGAIISDTNIGAVKIGTTLLQGIKGGSGADSGAITAGGTFAGKIASLTVSGSIVGGTQSGSGLVSSKTTIGAVKIGGDIDATSVGSATSVAGIEAEGAITSLTIGGTIKGGANALTGFVSAGAGLGAVKVGGLAGGAGTNSASISAGGKIASLTVTGDVVGSSGFGSASVSSGGDLDLLGDIGAIKIGGKLQGGSVQNSGSISSGGKIASIAIGPATAVNQVLLAGGGGMFSGSIFSLGAIGAVKVTGSVEGGAGTFSGSIVSHDLITSDFEHAGSIGSVTIAGHVKGGNGNDSAQIRADGHITSVSIGTAGGVDDDLTAGVGQRSADIRSGQGTVEPGSLGAVSIKGSMVNSSGGTQGAGIFAEGRITSVSVTKSINGGTIRAGDDIGAITVAGDVINAKISARGQAVQGATTDLAIGRITIGGNVATSSIRAGYDTLFTEAVNPDAQIGAVSVAGNWTASDLVAGVMDGGAAGFGTAGDVKISGTDNAKIISQIASIVIGGTVTGTNYSSTDHFGFVAQKVGAMKIAGVVVPIPSAGGEPFQLAMTGASPTNDVTLLEVPV